MIIHKRYFNGANYVFLCMQKQRKYNIDQARDHWDKVTCKECLKYKNKEKING